MTTTIQTASNPNGLTDAQVKQGYSTIPGPYDPLTGLKKVPTAVNPPAPVNTTPIPGVSSAVSNAVKSSGLYDPNSTVDNSKISGSSSILQNQNLSSSLNNAATSLKSKPPVTYAPLAENTPPIFGTSGPAIATLQTQLNAKNQGIAGYTPLKVDGKYGPATQAATQFNPAGASAGGSQAASNGATTDPATGNTTFPNGMIVDKSGKTISPGTEATHTTPPTPTTVTNDSMGGTRTTYSDGSTSYIPPSPAISSLYTQYDNAVSQETTSYNDSTNQQNTQYQEQIDQYKDQMKQAQDAAEANYNTNNPEGSGSDKSEFLTSVTKPYLTAINNLTTNHLQTMQQLTDAHQANIQNLGTQLQSGLAANQANIQSAGKDSYGEWSKALAGDGTDDPTVGAQALMAQNSGNPAYTWDMALSQANSAINRQTIATNKTLSTEERANATAASESFFRAIGQITTPFEQLPDASKMALIQQAIDAKLAPDATSAYQLVTSMNKSSVQASLQQQKEIDAQNRLAIASERAANSTTKTGINDVQTFFKNSLATNPNAFDAVKGMNTTDQTGWIADTAHTLNADPAEVALALNFMGVKLTPDTIKKTSAPFKLFGIIPTPFHTTTTTDTSKSTDSSTATTSTIPAGYYQASDGKYYKN